MCKGGNTQIPRGFPSPWNSAGAAKTKTEQLRNPSFGFPAFLTEFPPFFSWNKSLGNDPAPPSQHLTSAPDREEGLEFLIFFHRKEVHKSSEEFDTERPRGRGAKSREKKPSQVFWNSWKSSLKPENLLRKGGEKKSLCRSGIQPGFLGNFLGNCSI